MRLKIAVLAGDGIGPEVTREAVNILRAVAELGGHDFTFTDALIGGVAITAAGTPLPTATLDMALDSDAVLLGAVGDNKFNALMFLSSLFFIGIFFAYTMNDTERRGELDPDQNMKVWEKTGEAAPGGMLTKEPHPVGSGEHAPAPGAADPHGATPVQQH